MKLFNRAMAGQKLALGSGLVSVDADGCVDVEDKATCEALAKSGFKPAFSKKKADADAAPVKVEAGVASLSTSKTELKPEKTFGKKGK